MAKKPLEIDMIAGSQLKDTQGEMLSVEGADISELESGNGRLNDNHGKGFFNSIGRVTKAHKVFKEEDCADDRERYYWDKIKAPFIYVKGLLYDDEDHPNAKAAAAILRNIHKADIPLKLKASVEGGVISRGLKDPSLLARTKIHSVALTFTPANNATLVEPTSLDKSNVDFEADMRLIKSVEHLAQTNVPSFRHIYRDAKAQHVYENLCKISDLFREEGISLSNIPSKEEILRKAIEAKIKNNIVKIHAIIKDTDEEELSKGIKNALAGAVTAASLMSPAPAAAKPPMRAPSMVHAQKQAQPNPILDAISQVESSGGKNLNHKTMQHGIHAGMTAGGKYAMMPLSAQYTLKNDPALAKKYPELVESAKDLKGHHKDFTDRFNKDPQVAEDFAQSFYKRTKSKTKSPEMLIHAWNHGLKGTWDKYKRDPDSIKNDEYVKAVQDAMQRMHLRKSIDWDKQTMYDLGDKFDDKDRKQGQTNAINWTKDVSYHNPFKTMVNPETNKPELHVMAHRGVSNLNPNLEGKNALKVDDTHIHTKGDSVHSLSPHAANEYADNSKGKGKDGVLSFWAPVSKINYAPGDDHKDSHALAQGHVNIAEGSFPRVTKEEMLDIHNKSGEYNKANRANRIKGQAKDLEAMHKKFKISPKGFGLSSDDYNEAAKEHVDKREKLDNLMNVKHLYPKSQVNKALTAGFGGSGAPMGRTGGGVLQTESLDDGRKGLKYIGCDKCGKEAVYMKHQVKCRTCGDNFSLKKLYEVMGKHEKL